MEMKVEFRGLAAENVEKFPRDDVRRPLAATCGHSSGCKWLPLPKSNYAPPACSMHISYIASGERNCKILQFFFAKRAVIVPLPKDVHPSNCSGCKPETCKDYAKIAMMPWRHGALVGESPYATKKCIRAAPAPTKCLCLSMPTTRQAEHGVRPHPCGT